MKASQHPPEAKHDSVDFPKLVSNPSFRNLLTDPLVRGRYVHWDKLRHFEPPKGLNLEQWWLGLKIARMGGRRFLPLLDKKGKPFSFILPDPAQQLLHSLSMGIGGKVQLPEKIANKHTRDQYYVSSLIQESITSSQLEGATTTRLVAEEMLRTGRSPRDRSEQMILNNYRTMRRIGELKNQALTVDTVLELQRLVTEETLDTRDAAGRIRRPNELVEVVGTDHGEVFHVPPLADELPDRMRKMRDFANGKGVEGFIHPIVRAIVLHFWLAFDHPFVDGNGRTARALFYWSMLREDFWLAEFISISSVLVRAPARYARAFLYTESDDNDLTYFVLFHLDLLSRAVDELHKYISRKTETIQALEERLRGMESLNYRQRELISHALRHPRQQYTIQSHMTSHQVAWATSRNDLLNLESRGYLKKTRRGNEFVFMPVDDLESTLAR